MLNILTQKAEKAVLWRFKMKVNDLMNIVWIIIPLKKAFQDYIIRNLRLEPYINFWNSEKAY